MIIYNGLGTRPDVFVSVRNAGHTFTQYAVILPLTDLLGGLATCNIDKKREI